MGLPHATGSSSTEPTQPPTVLKPRNGPANLASVDAIAEATTLLIDVEALHATADGLDVLRLPNPVVVPSPGATGDEVLDAVLGEFCHRYNQLFEDTASDHSAAIGHLRGTATDYAAAEAAITRSLDTAALNPTTTASEGTPEATRSARA